MTTKPPYDAKRTSSIPPTSTSAAPGSSNSHPEVVDDPWSATLARRLANLERAGLPVTDYLSAALDDGPTTVSRPLPDAHTAAALWWRIVPHLGPTALDLDAHEDPLRPDWLADLTTTIGAKHLDDAQRSPAWPALVASVDDACREHGWTPGGLLTAAAHSSTNLETASQVAEAVEALVFWIASLTDPPKQLATRDPTPHPFVNDEANSEGPRSSFADQDGPDSAVVTRIHELNQIALDFYTQCYLRSWAPTYLAERFKTPADLLTAIAGYAPPGPTSLVRHMASLGIDPEELIDAGLARTREQGGGREVVDVFKTGSSSQCTPWLLRARPATNATPPSQGSSADAIPTARTTSTPGPSTSTLVAPRRSRSRASLRSRRSVTRPPCGSQPHRCRRPDGRDRHQPRPPREGHRHRTDGHRPDLQPGPTAAPTAVGRHDQLVVATDGDPAGWRAESAAYWLLTAEDLDPSILGLADESDPASILHDEGPDALRALLANRRSLGDLMIDDALRTATDWTDASARQSFSGRSATSSQPDLPRLGRPRSKPSASACTSPPASSSTASWPTAANATPIRLRGQVNVFGRQGPRQPTLNRQPNAACRTTGRRPDPDARLPAGAQPPSYQARTHCRALTS